MDDDEYLLRYGSKESKGEVDWDATELKKNAILVLGGMHDISQWIAFDLGEKGFNVRVAVSDRKKAIDIYPERLRLKVLDNIVIFDQNKNIVNSNLNSKINAKILINISHIYVNNDKLVYGIHFNTHQVQVINYLPKIIQFSFLLR